MAITKSRMTEEEFMRLPQDGRKYELVDGEAKEVPTSHEHDAIDIKIAVLMYPFARGRGVLAGAQAGFRMKGGNIRCPDMSYTRKERLPGGKPSRGFGPVAPDLCIEIVSPSEEPAEIARKRAEYFDSGAQFVWYLYPETQRLIAYRSPNEFTIYEADAEIDLPDLLPGFRCRVGGFFDTE